MQDYELLGRDESLFASDISKYESSLFEIISQSKFLVIGGAGTIGSSVVRELLKEMHSRLMSSISVKII